MLEEAIRYLGDADDRVKTIAIGGLLTLLAPLVVPTFGVLGYVVRVIDRTADGDDEPPSFDDLGALFVDGAKAFAIAVVYGLVPAVIGGVIAALGLGLGGLGDSGALGVVGLVVGGLVWLVLALGAAYVVPAALANFSERRSLADGFAVGDLRAVLTSSTYATGWLYALGVVLAGGLVGGALNAIPVLGTFVSAFVSFYTLVAAYYIIGHTWGELRPTVVRDERVPEERTAV